jgi:glycosyltransferase involved in cell wall biosynthesis
MSLIVSVIIVTYNDKSKLLDCLHSLHEQTLPDDLREILVVDDGSTDGTTEEVRRTFSDTRVIRKEHGGADTSRQLGVNVAGGKYLAFIDSDCIAPADWLEKIVDALQSNEDIAVGGRIVHRGSFLTRLVGIADFGEFQGTQEKEVTTLPTCNIAVAKQLANEFPFNSELPAGGDTAFCHRLRQGGKRIVFHPEVMIFHRPDPSLKQFFRRGARYGRSFVHLRILDPSVRYAGFLRAGLPGVVFATLGRAAVDIWRLIRYRKNAGFNFLELLPASLFLLAYRVYSLPSAYRAYRTLGS